MADQYISPAKNVRKWPVNEYHRPQSLLISNSSTMPSPKTSQTPTTAQLPPSSWTETTLGEVCKVVNGGTPSTRVKEFWNGNIPWITPKDLSNNHSMYIGQGERSITKTGLINSSAQLIPKNTILFSSRAPIGYVALANREMTTNQGFKNFICDEIISHYKFFYYLLVNIAPYIEKLSSGSTFSEASASLMKSVDISLPPLPEQKAIADVLSAFDDKIELLRQQNQTLETLGQTIFHERFGRYSPDRPDELPEGWRAYGLSEIVNTVNGYSYKGNELQEQSNEALVSLKSFDRNGGFKTSGFKPFIGTPKSTQEVRIGDLVVAHTDLTQDAEVLGNPAFIFDNAGYEKMYITMDLVKVESKDDNITNAFLYYLMRSRKFKGHCIGYSNGTTVLHLSKKAIPEYQITLPKNLVKLKTISETLKQTTDKIAENYKQIQSLTRTRDALLPKLMRGEVRIDF